MQGRPVWLASVSRRRASGRTVYVPEWSAPQLREAERLLRRQLDGVGDTTRERLFRMNVTLCLHRAASDVDLSLVPAWFLSAPGVGLAGGPVAVLRETEPGSASTQPCVAPRREVVDATSAHGWIPIDCGDCASCRARHAIV